MMEKKEMKRLIRKKIKKNLQILDNTSSNIEVSIATAIQILNIKHIVDFAKWKLSKNYNKTLNYIPESVKIIRNFFL